MKNPIKRLALLSLACSIVVSLAAAMWLEPQQPSSSASPTSTAASSIRLVYAQPFELDEPYLHNWRAERPTVRAGFLLVLATDPESLVRRETAEPVLYVGTQTAERLNNGSTYGRVVVVVPAGLDENGNVDLDLARTHIWFGDRALPERITAGDIERSRTDALGRGVRPSPASDVEMARMRGGDTVYLANRMALRLYATDLIEAYAPDEVDLVRGIRGY